MRLTYLVPSFAVVLMLCGGVSADVIGHYTFDTDFSDSSGTGNDGTPEGDAAIAAFQGVDGVGGGALEVGSSLATGGAGGHVVVPIDINASVLPDASVTMWVKADASLVDNDYFGLHKTFGHDNGAWDRTIGLDARLNSGAQSVDNYRWAAFTGGAGPGPTPATSTPVSTDWTFLAAVWDSDDPGPGFASVTFYASTADGMTSTTGTLPLSQNSGWAEAAIGSLRPDNFAEPFVGLIDNVTIHDEALTPELVESWKNMTGPVPEPTSAILIGWALLGLGLVRRKR